HLIGGGVEPDESLEDGIKREIREEANIEVEILERLGFDDDFEPDKHGELTHYIFLVYKVKYIFGEAKADDDLVDLKWFSKNELPESEFNRPTLKLFKKIGYLKS
ncbi:MAG: NUDIX domain-containing protein, partial [Candidatus Buchananbacteria bacterium]|nr:NUDIX domain-containing protein [Candidatus Buchananbacteria bacterium]